MVGWGPKRDGVGEDGFVPKRVEPAEGEVPKSDVEAVVAEWDALPNKDEVVVAEFEAPPNKGVVVVV